MRHKLEFALSYATPADLLRGVAKLFVTELGDTKRPAQRRPEVPARTETAERSAAIWARLRQGMGQPSARTAFRHRLRTERYAPVTKRVSAGGPSSRSRLIASTRSPATNRLNTTTATTTSDKTTFAVVALPGFRAGYHFRNTETGKALSISVFESREAGEGARDALAQRPPDKRVNIEPDAVEFYEVIEF